VLYENDDCVNERMNLKNSRAYI